jgi:hypothetical protein
MVTVNYYMFRPLTGHHQIVPYDDLLEAETCSSYCYHRLIYIIIIWLYFNFKFLLCKFVI